MEHLNIKVLGKVQGVYFRASTKQTADLLGIKGIVKNDKDGSVYIEAEGSPEALTKFIEWLNVGPELAEVTEVIPEKGVIKIYNNFEIVREKSL